MATRKPKNILANKAASVTIHRNGLSVEIQAVPATESGLVAQALLDMVRDLTNAGYEELVQDGGSFHGSGHDQAPEEDGEDYVIAPSAKRRRIGFF